MCNVRRKRLLYLILNNTAPEGIITRALKGLTTLSEELAENSGVDTLFSGVFESWSGKWKGVIVFLVTSLVAVFGVLIALGCCIIPCVRGLTQRLIETAITKRIPLGNPPPYKDGDMLCLKDEEDNEQRSQALLQQFEQQYETIE